ncbi:MAG: lysophospholipase, partial [Bacteroidales bacterium]|jgi:alpha-beta hydrolase superfamily lysophospholipase|nr:lysophospholipase [Bacteroidales bacterium]
MMREWLPANDMAAILIVVHGIGEHSGCYDKWATMFVAQSIGVVAADLRGHGRSSGKRGHAALTDLKADLKAVIQKVHEEHSTAKLLLYGHSMGGLIALSYAESKDAAIAGIIATSPWLELLHPPSRLLIKAACAAATVFPSWRVTTGIKAGELTLNGSEKSSKTDPLIHKKISIRLFTDMWKESRRILQNDFHPNIPVLLMYGNQDRLISYRAGELFANAADNISYKLWDGMGHDLHCETGNQPILQHIIEWKSSVIHNS